MQKVIAANIDILVIMAAVTDPPFRPALIERYLVAAARGGIQSILCLTKVDLSADTSAAEVYRDAGVALVARLRCRQRPDRRLRQLSPAFRPFRCVARPDSCHARTDVYRNKRRHRAGRRGLRMVADKAIWLIGVQIGANLLLQILQFAFHRPRPDPFFGLAKPNSYSFPSGHALLSTVFYLSLAILMTRNIAVRIAAALLALLIGLSRIYLGVHYPTDVLAGFSAGAFWLSMWVYGTRNVPAI